MVELRIPRRYRRRRLPLGLAAVAAAGLVVVGCGSSATKAASNGVTTTLPSATTAPASGAKTTVDTVSSKYGTILVDNSGMTLYMFTADTAKASACTGACLAVWPPLVVKGTPTAGPGLKASLVSTITSSSGAHQVTYNGHPLYTFAKDKAPGQINGEGINHFGGLWYVIDAAGQPVTAAPSSSTSPTTTSSGYNY